MKKEWLIILLAVQTLQAQSDIDLVVVYRTFGDIEQTAGGQVDITSGEEVIGTQAFANDHLIHNRAETVFPSQGKSEFQVNFTVGERTEEQVFAVDDRTKRVEIRLTFSSNENGVEYLQDLTIKKVLFPEDDLTLERLHYAKVGQYPIYRIINSGDQEYHGQSATRHFYGALYLFDEEHGWRFHTAGSYCHSTIPEKVLCRGDTVYSYVPSYSPGEEYRFKHLKRHKFAVVLGYEPYNAGIPLALVNKAITRKRVIEVVELEDEFIVKQD